MSLLKTELDSQIEDMAFATTLNRMNRLVSMLSDHVIMTMVVGVLWAPVLFFRIRQEAEFGIAGDLFVGQPLYVAFLFSLYFNKDIYLGQSIGKRILRFRVINKRTGEPAGPLRCLVRNLTLIVWPVEVIMAMVNVNERLGDYIAGTQLVNYERPTGGKANGVMMGVAVLLGMVFVYVVMLMPMIGIMRLVFRFRDPSAY
jgi:hypothetical protein